MSPTAPLEDFSLCQAPGGKISVDTNEFDKSIYLGKPGASVFCHQLLEELGMSRFQGAGHLRESVLFLINIMSCVIQSLKILYNHFVTTESSLMSILLTCLDQDQS